ncbi:carboxylate-amine ligase [Benzoatithermus flavus]|uniref:Putative glutamate--cysteine ligase 2 n=1 Tax=Benzoatithermus flavus TaxID=3108223 RepID=A0ABU8XSH7_9PROT
MAPRKPTLSLGIEEEYLLVDPLTRALVQSPDPGFMTACEDALGEQVTNELLQSQVEVGTCICARIAEARSDLARLRRTVAAIARDHGMGLIAASTHPFAEWDEQRSTELDRYQSLTDDYQALARRQLIGGMHVHVAVEDEELRIDFMNQAGYFLPHLLALSTSSPFWRGRPTGLKAFRPSVFGNLPRSGSAEYLASWSAWRDLLDLLAGTGLCSDPTQVWWDIRPSAKHPTLELRITDVCTSLEDALAIAALFQALLHRLWRLRTCNQSWRVYRRILLEENKWRAQRYGIEAELADLGAGCLKPMPMLIEELIELVREDAGELGCLAEVERAREIVERGTSADRQLALYHEALREGASPEEACRMVVDWLLEATLAGLPE